MTPVLFKGSKNNQQFINILRIDSCRLNNQRKQMPQLEPKTDDLCRSKYIDVLLLFKFRLVDEKDRIF